MSILKRIFSFALLLPLLFACNQEDNSEGYELAKAKAKTHMKAPPAEPDPITWTKPKTWEEYPKQGMRLASFISRAAGKKADVSVVFLAGRGGGDLANINRWRQQIRLGRWTESEMLALSSFVETPVGHARTVHLTSDSSFTGSKELSIHGAIIPTHKGTWFVKMTGEKALVEEEREQFNSFLQSLRAKSTDAYIPREAD